MIITEREWSPSSKPSLNPTCTLRVVQYNLLLKTSDSDKQPHKAWKLKGGLELGVRPSGLWNPAPLAPTAVFRQVEGQCFKIFYFQPQSWGNYSCLCMSEPRGLASLVLSDPSCIPPCLLRRLCLFCHLIFSCPFASPSFHTYITASSTSATSAWWKCCVRSPMSLDFFRKLQGLPSQEFWAASHHPCAISPSLTFCPSSSCLTSFLEWDFAPNTAQWHQQKQHKVATVHHHLTS